MKVRCPLIRLIWPNGAPIEVLPGKCSARFKCIPRNKGERHVRIVNPRAVQGPPPGVHISGDRCQPRNLCRHHGPDPLGGLAFFLWSGARHGRWAEHFDEPRMSGSGSRTCWMRKGLKTDRRALILGE